MVSFWIAVAVLVSTPPGAGTRAAQSEALAPTRSQAPDAQLPQVATSLRALLPLIERVPESTLATRAVKQRAAAALHTLLALSVNWPAKSPVDYRLHLAKEVRALSQALDSFDPARLHRGIQAVADDLDIKLEHSRLSGGRLGGSVTVRVRVLRGAEEVRDVEIFCLPTIVQLLGAASPERFPQANGSRHATLVPGRYLIWLRDPATNVEAEPTLVKVGEGRRELQLDLLAPAPRAR